MPYVAARLPRSRHENFYESCTLRTRLWSIAFPGSLNRTEAREIARQTAAISEECWLDAAAIFIKLIFPKEGPPKPLFIWDVADCFPSSSVNFPCQPPNQAIAPEQFH